MACLDDSYQETKSRFEVAASMAGRKSEDIELIAVSKTWPIEMISDLVNCGHKIFGENKVQEANEKWTDILNDFKHLKLHMIGKLQTNKVKFAVRLFDYIHSLDNYKLAKKISDEENKNNKKLKIFISVAEGFCKSDNTKLLKISSRHFKSNLWENQDCFTR